MLMGRAAARFSRVEPRPHARDLVSGLLAGLARANCWNTPSTLARPIRAVCSTCTWTLLAPLDHPRAHDVSSLSDAFALPGSVLTCGYLDRPWTSSSPQGLLSR